MSEAQSQLDVRFDVGFYFPLDRLGMHHGI